MPRAESVTIDLASLTAAEWATVRAVAAEGGVPLAECDFIAAHDGTLHLPVPVLAGLLYVTMRRAAPRITPRRCVRLALAAAGVA